MVRKIHLLAINGLMWTAIGTKIAITGISHYIQIVREAMSDGAAAPLAGLSKLWWMIPHDVHRGGAQVFGAHPCPAR